MQNVWREERRHEAHTRSTLRSWFVRRRRREVHLLKSFQLWKPTNNATLSNNSTEGFSAPDICAHSFFSIVGSTPRVVLQTQTPTSQSRLPWLRSVRISFYSLYQRC